MNNNKVTVFELEGIQYNVQDPRTNDTFTTDSFAVGQKAQASVMGYYVSAFVPVTEIGEDGVIYLTTERMNPIWLAEADDTHKKSEFKDISAINDYIFSIAAFSYYHWPIIGIITKVENNKITYQLANDAPGRLTPKWAQNQIPEGDTIPFQFYLHNTTLYDFGEVPFGNGAVAFGYDAVAAADYSYATGIYTASIGAYGHAEGNGTKAGYAAHAEGMDTMALGQQSHAEGTRTIAYGMDSLAQGASDSLEGYEAIQFSENPNGTKEDIKEAWLEAANKFLLAYNQQSHAEGKNTLALGPQSHSEGFETIAYALCTHAEGNTTQAIGLNSHSEGANTVANGESSHAEGMASTAKGKGSHVEGRNTSTTSAAQYAHAEGDASSVSGFAAHAEGYSTVAKGNYSHAEGFATEAAGNYQHVSGKYNLPIATNTAYIIGCGSSGARNNAFTVSWDGRATANTYATRGADYAEYFEWLDGNPVAEDRVGYLVTLVGDKITKSQPGDKVFGIVSAAPGVLGDNPEWYWHNRFLTDDFGRLIYEEVEVFEEVYNEETEQWETMFLGFEKHPILNPAYDPEQEYVRRSDRPEWDAVGFLGKLYLRDDGTCVPGGYVTAGANGIATNSTTETNIQVMKRTADNIVYVFIK